MFDLFKVIRHFVFGKLPGTLCFVLSKLSCTGLFIISNAIVTSVAVWNLSLLEVNPDFCECFFLLVSNRGLKFVISLYCETG